MNELDLNMTEQSLIDKGWIISHEWVESQYDRVKSNW